MNNIRSAATVMPGLEGMVVLAVSERDAELEYAIETTAVSGWCPVCGRWRGCMIDARPGCGICLPWTAGDLVWVKRVWGYVHPQCEQQTWTETYPAIAPRSSWAERARARRVVRWAATSIRWPRWPVIPGWAGPR